MFVSERVKFLGWFFGAAAPSFAPAPRVGCEFVEELMVFCMGGEL